MCLEYDLKGRDMTTDQILKYIVSNLSDNKSRKGLNAVFDSLKIKKLEKLHVGNSKII